MGNYFTQILFEFFLASFQNDPVPCKSILLNRMVNIGELLTIDGYTTLLDRTATLGTAWYQLCFLQRSVIRSIFSFLVKNLPLKALL